MTASSLSVAQRLVRSAGRIQAVLSHRANGPGFAVALLRAMIGGFYSFIAFSLTVSVLLAHASIAVTFAAAVAAAVVVQWIAKAIMMRLASREGAR